jgi:hypothetical protein
MPARAELIRRRFIQNLTSNRAFASPQNSVPILRHNSPDERRAFEHDKIVSNLPEQIRGPGYRNQTHSAGMVRGLQSQRIMLIASALFATQGEHDGR